MSGNPAGEPGPVRTVLADGRELLYFFDAGHRADPAPPPDLRSLAPRPATPELRYDGLLGDWVSYATHRQDRTHLPPADECPLCPSAPGKPSEIPATHYDVAVFENRFPAFGPAVADGGTPAAPDGYGAAVGRCEVISFTPDHGASFPGLGRERARTVIRAWTHRTAALSQIPGVRQVFVFENRGAEIGVTLHHPHGQIYAYPYITPRTRTQLETAADHRRRTGTNLFADLLERELTDGRRIVARGRHWTAYVPFAARMPVEVHLVPHRAVPDLPSLTRSEADELADVYLDVIRRIEALYVTPTPYIAACYQAPVDRADQPPGERAAQGEYRMHVQVSSPRRAGNKLKYLAGSEAAMGAFVADVLPEETAARLRAAQPPFGAGTGEQAIPGGGVPAVQAPQPAAEPGRA